MNEPAPITDTERIDWIARQQAIFCGCPPEQFRAEVDARIMAATPEPLAADEWIDLTVEFPNDESPVVVEAGDGRSGVVCYCSEAGDWYLHYPGAEIHGRLWSEVYGPASEIVKWKPKRG